MAPKKPSSSSSPITIGNCQVVVEAKNYKAESNETTLQIAISKYVKIVVSVLEDVPGKESNDVECSGVKENGYYFVLVNPKDSDAQSKSLLQEILNLYAKELPSMNYAANTGKKSMFLERCVSNGKYCTLVLKSKSEEGPGEVIAAISFQIIPADTQYAEVPLAAVSSVYQHKGIGQLTYLEMRKRLQSVGVHSIFCWADEESEGFWLKQGFVTVGQVDTKGRARRLPIKADIRKALCFPGGASLMVSHLEKERSDNSAVTLKLSSLVKPFQKSLADSINQNQNSGAEDVLKNNHSMDIGCQDLVCLDSLEGINTGYGADEMEIITDGDARQCSCSTSGGKKRTWEASKTSLKSKKVKGSHMIACQSDSGCASRINKTDDCYMDVSPINLSKDENSTYFTPAFGGPLSNNHVDKTQEINGYKIMLMNIADDAKKSNLTKIIEDLGGCVTSDGTVSTHVITGKVRKTLNFCTALCSGAWVISPAWLKESFRARLFVDETPYILEDLDYESKYRTDLKGAVLRARANPGTLLKGFEVCLAAHVQPPIDTLSAIVRSAGGNVIQDVEKAKDLKKTIFVASEDNMEEASIAIEKGIPTFSHEWFMNCVMKQELDLEAPQLAESL
ncbi:Acyl-CoA N-acyltransferase [Artemisia annua]|uniref:Acyl-CoA N-acyltransferase n=1 Tax=Artemisia annua TaxID=35608 RepID=A0A2U1L779_ARTAN|nr:Acyl-CoA N-acyltransferase [Artemisia annua]